MGKSIRVRRVSLALLVVSWVALLSAPAYAQSAIAGVVTDETRGVLPGVTVEAASPALIEKVRTAVTDAQGRYAIIDLRPGTYTVTFTLQGFTTIVRDGIELPANFTAPVNVMLTVGGIEESLTVSGGSPVVDVQQTQRTQVITREVLDAVPTGKNIQSVGSLVVGVRLSSPDVGGARGMQMTTLSAHGASGRHMTFQVDGMIVDGLQQGDTSQIVNYFNDQMNQEVTYQTSGISAETSVGGVRVNMIPRDGGNTFSGSAFIGGSSGAWQSDNLSTRLRSLGVQAVDRIDRIFDVNGAQGGPIKRDRLWFFTSARYWGVDNPVAGTFFADGRQGVDDNFIHSYLARLTWQVTPRNKFAVYMDRIIKWRGHEMGAGVDPATAAGRRDPIIYYTGQAKWTSTVSSRLLLEGGYSTNIENFSVFYQPGIRAARGTPEWYTRVRKEDRDLGTSWGAYAQERARYPERFAASGSASYVTGSHSFKTGLQTTWGPQLQTIEANGDLRQRYRSGVPDSVVVLNTPIWMRPRLDYDLGLYAQDQWTIDRFTVNAGLRFEWLRGSLDEQFAPAGRFVPGRRFDVIENLPDWFDVTPRFGLAYDVFGDAKTALKFTAGKYVKSETTLFAETYNPFQYVTAAIPWNDRDLLGRSLPTNGDDIAQDNEIDVNRLPANFGARQLNTQDPDIRREYNVMMSASVQHELFSGVSLTVGWYRRSFHNLFLTDNLLRSFDNYVPVEIVSPLNGEVIPAYNLKSVSLLSAIDNFDTNASDRSQIYNGFQTEFSARLPGGGTFFGGITTQRTISVTCDEPDDPNNLRFCDRGNLPDPYRVPFKTDLKLVGSYPLPGGVQLSTSFQSYAGDALASNWLITRTTRYAATCVGPCRPGALVIPGLVESSLTVPLLPSGSERYLPRLNQLDISAKKIFQVQNVRLEAQVDLFNVLNTDAEYSHRSENFGTAAYGVPARTLPGRIPRLALQMKW